MTEASIEINPSASLAIRTVGRAKVPVLIVDDFAVDTTDIVDYACDRVRYSPDPTSRYPGLRADLPRAYVRTVLNGIYRLIFHAYSVPAELGMRPVNAVYSLIATPENELEPVQCIPHFDSSRPCYLAVLHYLNQGDFCDTGLFRHRPTGLEKITADDLERYIESRDTHIAALGRSPGAYVKASNEHYELYERIEYRANRLVVYPGCLLHSGLVDPAVDINPDPRTGRLTANIFVDFFPLEGTG